METIVVTRIKQIIDAEGETPNSFAGKIGVTSNSVYNILKGGQPRISTIDKIVAAYPQYTKEWVLGGEGKLVSGAKDFEVKKLQDDLAAANKEIERLWGVINHFTGGKVNFLEASIYTGATKRKQVRIPVISLGAQMGARA